jgi:hypothetical protein
MPTADVDVERIVRTLNDHHVDYVVVGGFAVELWDVAVPPTHDIDVTPALSPENLARLCEAINELGAAIRISGSESVSIPGGITPELVGRIKVLNLVTDAGPLDITTVPEGTNGFADLVANATDIMYGALRVPTASLVDVARSKEAAGREKDLRTLPAIRAHLERRTS